MMKMKTAMWWVVIAVLVLPFSLAEPMQTIALNCGFSSATTLTCGSTLTLLCNVTTTLANGQPSPAAITTVVAQINGEQETMSLYAGTAYNGTWRVQKTVGASYAHESVVKLEGVTVMDKSAFSCFSATDGADGIGCPLTNGIIQVANDCACAYVESFGPVTPDNRRSLTKTLEAGCSGVSGAPEYVWADYCDPGWVPQYSACTGAWGVGVANMSGTMTKTYTSTNPTCCSATRASGAGVGDVNHEGGSDCNPPIDGNGAATFQCQQEVWPSYQLTTYATGNNRRSEGFREDSYTTYSSNVVQGTQPLMWDFDRDGREEIIVVDDNSKYVRMYSHKMQLESQVFVSGLMSAGQSALWGINDFSGTSAASGYDVAASVEVGTSNPKIIVPMMVGSSAQVRVYNVSVSGGVGTLVELVANRRTYGSVDISGVNCLLGHAYGKPDSCYVMTSDGVGYQFEPDDVQANDRSQGLFGYFSGGSWVVNSYQKVFNRNMVPMFIGGAVTNEYPPVYVVWWVYDRSFFVGFDQKTQVQLIVTQSNMTPNRAFLLRSPDVNAGVEQSFYSWNPTVVRRATENESLSQVLDYIMLSTKQTTSSNNTYFSVFSVPYLLSSSFVENLVMSEPQRKVVWQGDEVANDCLSNVVQAECNGDGVQYGGLMYNVLDDNQVGLGLSSFDAPSIGGVVANSNTNFTQVFFTGDKQYAVLIVGASYGATSTISFRRVSDGAIIWSQSVGGFQSGMGAATFDAENDVLYYVYRFDNAGPSGWNLRAVAFVNRASPAVYTIAGRGLSFSNTAPNSIILTEEYVAANEYFGGLYFHFTSRRTIPNVSMTVFSTGLGFGSYGVSNNAMDETGIAMLGSAMTLDIDNFLETSGVNATLYGTGGYSVSNRQVASPKFLVSNNRKLVVTSLNPFTYYVTATGCPSYFSPLFYGSDRYIFGMITDTLHGGPRYGWCDFSDEISPVIGGVYGLLTTNYSDATQRLSATEYIVTGSSTNVAPNNPRFVNFDETQEAPGESVQGSNARALCIDPVLGVAREAIIPQSVGCGPLTAVDVDADGTDELLSMGGIENMGTNEWMVTFRQNRLFYNTSWVLPVDIDGNYRTDLLYVSPSEQVIKMLVSNIGLESVAIGDPVLSTLNCVVRNGSNVVTVQVAGTMPNPEATTISLTSSDGRSLTFSRAEGPNIDVSFASSGTYSIVAKLVQAYPSYVETATKSCSVNIVLPEVGKCSLEADGEFNYVDFLSNHGWTGTGSSKIPSAGFITLVPSDSVSYAVDQCNEYSVVTVRERLYADSLSKLTLKDVDGKVIAGFLVDLGTVYTLAGNPVVSVTPGAAIVVDIELDAATNKVNWYVDGVVKSSVDQVFSTLGSVSITGPGAVDYVRILKSGVSVGGVVEGDLGTEGAVQCLKGDYSVLADCDAELRNDPSADVRRSYPTLARYCASNGLTGCRYGELQCVVAYNQQCWKEAYNYCVRVGYGLEEGTIYSESNLEGGTVCTAVLGMSSGFNSIVKPTVKVGWAVLTSNAVVALVLLLVLIVIGGFVVKQRGR